MIRAWFDCPEEILELRALEFKKKMCRDLIDGKTIVKIERLKWNNLAIERPKNLARVMKARESIKTALNTQSSRTIGYFEVTNRQTQERVSFVDFPGSEGVEASDSSLLTPAERTVVSSTRRDFVTELSSFKHHTIKYNNPLSGTPCLNELSRRVFGDVGVSNKNIFLVLCAQSPLDYTHTVDVGNFLRDIRAERDSSFKRGSRSPSPSAKIINYPSRKSLLRRVETLVGENEQLRQANLNLRQRFEAAQSKPVGDVAEAEVAAVVVVAVEGKEDVEEEERRVDLEAVAEAEVKSVAEARAEAEAEAEVRDETEPEAGAEAVDDEEDKYSLLGVPDLLRPEFRHKNVWYVVDRPEIYQNIEWNDTIEQVGSTTRYRCCLCEEVFERCLIKLHVWFSEKNGKVVCDKCKQPYRDVGFIHNRHRPKCNGQTRKAGRPKKNNNIFE